ncbi:putative serine/threonine-protein kinase [Phytophthora citrophthora]|uniref:Serine/threonine-protein kinase n=1 Tax=Phytophthora citrophthora TaxID=4793 RepID=A0AAD9GMH6_9STRA|nr:putative serine/threonine-protein kinase [Phytophthora citrophthora]
MGTGDDVEMEFISVMGVLVPMEVTKGVSKEALRVATGSISSESESETCNNNLSCQEDQIHSSIIVDSGVAQRKMEQNVGESDYKKEIPNSNETEENLHPTPVSKQKNRKRRVSRKSMDSSGVGKMQKKVKEEDTKSKVTKTQLKKKPKVLAGILPVFSQNGNEDIENVKPTGNLRTTPDVQDDKRLKQANEEVSTGNRISKMWALESDDEEKGNMKKKRKSSTGAIASSVAEEVNSRSSLEDTGVCTYPNCTQPMRYRYRCAKHNSRRRCSVLDCTKFAHSGGNCIAHGGGSRCMEDGCDRRSRSQGKCYAHGGGIRCSHPNCNTRAKSKGKCVAHGGGTICCERECSKLAISNGKCISHGGYMNCSLPGCDKRVQVRGKCIEHSEQEIPTKSGNCEQPTAFKEKQDETTMKLRSGQRVKLVPSWRNKPEVIQSEEETLEMVLKLSTIDSTLSSQVRNRCITKSVVMSVTPRAAPSMTERSRLMSRRGSNRDEEEIIVGAVVVMLSDKTEAQSAAYRLPNGDSGQDDAKLISSAVTQKESSFMAVLAPSCDGAMTSLQTQPPGTFLLVKEEDSAIAVYIKFRQAVRALTLVKAKDMKRNNDAIQLVKVRKKDMEQTPVHTLRLHSEAYCLVEHCWRRFLPQVQAIVFELCCEPHLDEETKLEDWTFAMIPPLAYSVGLMPEACGFYIFTAADAVIQVRQVEFDFNKFAINVADGTHKPSALLLATSFSAKRMFEPDFTFGAIRDNFLRPDLVMLKETSVNTIPSQQISLQNCIDLSSNDRELAVLNATDVACGLIMPHEPLSESFLAVLHEMHVHFVNSSVRDGPTLPSKPVQWSGPKVKLAGRIIPVLLELLIASATFSEPSDSDTHTTNMESIKRVALAQFARAMRFDILFMTARSDDTVLCRLTHQLCQLLGARVRIPAELVEIIRDLVALFPVFLRLFIRNQGITILWRNLHHNDVDKEASSDPEPKKSMSKSFRSLTSSTLAANTLPGKRERKQSLFGLARKPQRKSLSLGMTMTSTPFLNLKVLAFSRLNLLSVQVYLGIHLREGYFMCSDVWTEDPMLAKVAFCSCFGRKFTEPMPTFGNSGGKSMTMCPRKRLGSSPRLVTYELLLQLSLRFLHVKSPLVYGDRDIALLLRLEDVHHHLFTEIISTVRRRNETQDVNTREASSCELQVIITCVSTLYRLERKRRQEVSAVGDKKYVGFIHSFRTKIRDLIGRLKLGTYCDDEGTGGDEVFLTALAEVFKWIPKAFLNEWIVICLRDLFRLVNELDRLAKQPTTSLTKQHQFVRHGYELCKVFAAMLRRTSDPDLQTVLIRVLGMDCPAFISLLRFLLSPHSLALNSGRDAVCIQLHALNFLGAFVNLDVSLPVQTDWESKNRTPSDEGSLNEDAEVIEQLKGELLIRLLGPRMTLEDEEQNDQTLWDFMLELMFPAFATNNVASFSAASTMFGLASSFRSPSIQPIFLTSISRGHFQMKEAFFLLQQALYTAQDTNSPIDYEHCVASHWRRIEQYCDRIIENEGQEEHAMVSRMVELNFRCLIVLASRRSQFPAIQDAFNSNHVLAAVLQRIQPKGSFSNSDKSRCQRENSESVSSDEVSNIIPSLPPLKLRRSSCDSPDVPNISKLSLSSPHLSPQYDEVDLGQNFILLEPGLHALAIILVVTYIIVDPNLEIDEGICPRISVPGIECKPNELLWNLQQHLVVVELDQRHFEALVMEMEALQSFVSTARLSAVRLLLRLLCPNRFDCSMYSTQSDSREYVAKGAFSTVYRQHSALPGRESVAVKVVEHQRRTGELCPLSGLYNEISILSKLKGELAATQLIDFGNHQAEHSFEIAMEYCPCLLTEWRATITRSDDEVPFRSCVVMILRAFEEVCYCLIRIHEADVCHFDIKSDNILVRSSANELSRRLLENEEDSEEHTRPVNCKGWLCIADFGESKVVDINRVPIRTFTFSSFSSGMASPVAAQHRTERFMSLTRTRGTEAIKSPEVLKIKGSETIEVKVTLASDIWSLGCLLYELVTQELLFQNDDWAGLYAHLVVTQGEEVLRSDHRQKVFAALNPSPSDEEAVVTNLLELCSQILVRDPTRRPKLETIVAQVRKLVNDVYELPVTVSDQSFISNLYQSKEEIPIEIQPAPVFRPPPFVNCRKQEETQGTIVPVRLFWNLFFAAQVTRSPKSQTVVSCVGSGSGPASKDTLSMDAFEAKYEIAFVHFVYVSWHEPEDLTSQKSPQGFIQDLHEEEHRTCFQFNSRVKSNAEMLFQELVQYATQYFPVIQRRLRDEAGCVVFVTLGDAEDTKDLQEVLTCMLFFFFRAALNIPVFDILNHFARDCSQFFEYPQSEFLQLLQTYSIAHVEDTATSSMVQCRCGASVLTVDSAAFREALESQHCTCIQSEETNTHLKECACFHPFQDNFDDDVYPIDNMFVHDNAEERIVLPMETRIKRRDPIRWVVIDLSSVGRVAFRLSSNGSSTVSTGESERRISRFVLHRPSRVSGENSTPLEATRNATEPQELLGMLLQGLRSRGKISSDEAPSDSWEMFECELCRLPICAVREDALQVAVPVLHPHT